MKHLQKLLYIDSSYTLQAIKNMDLDQVLKVRELNGYWDKVWSVHPLDRQPGHEGNSNPFGRPEFVTLSDSHVFIRGAFGRFAWLRRVGPINVIFGLFSLVFTLIWLCRSEGIKTVRVGDPAFSGIIGLIVCFFSGAKLVVRINGDHDMIRQVTKAPIRKNLMRCIAVEEFLERRVLSQADAIILYTKTHLNFALSKGALEVNCHIVRYGGLINPIHFEAPEDRCEPTDPVILAKLKERPWMVHVGRLIPIKLAEHCLDVLEQLDAEGSNVGLCLIGDGPLRASMAQRAEKVGLAGRILFLGNIDQNNLAQVLPLCSVAISPLTGRALAETAYAGLPMVAYDLDWQGEIVETGITGILVKAYDSKAMGLAISEILNDAGARRKLGNAARQRALTMLSPNLQLEREINVYEGLVR